MENPTQANIKFIVKIRTPFDDKDEQYQEKKQTRSLTKKLQGSIKKVSKINLNGLSNSYKYTCFSGSKMSNSLMISKTPIHAKELNDVFSSEPDLALVDHEQINESRLFSFPSVYDERTKNEELFNREMKHLVKGLFTSNPVNILFFGPSNGGKDYTIFGENDNAKGIFYFSVREILNEIDVLNKKAKGKEILVLKLGAIEILSRKVYDIMNREKNKLIKMKRIKNKLTGGFKEFSVPQNLTIVKTIDEFDLWLKGFVLSQSKFSESNKSDKKSHLVLSLKIDMMGLKGKKVEVLKKNIYQMNIVKLRSTDQSLRDNDEKINLDSKKKNNVALKSITTLFSDLVTLKNHQVPAFESRLTLVLSSSFKERTNFLVCTCLLPTEEPPNSTKKAAHVYI